MEKHVDFCLSLVSSLSQNVYHVGGVIHWHYKIERVRQGSAPPSPHISFKEQAKNFSRSHQFSHVSLARIISYVHAVNMDSHLAEAVFLCISTEKLLSLPFPLSILYFLEGSFYVLLTFKVWRLILPFLEQGLSTKISWNSSAKCFQFPIIPPALF